MRLYELTQQYREVQELDPEIIGDTLDAIKGDIEEKAKDIGFVYKNLNAKLDAVNNEIARLKQIASSTEKRMESLKDYTRENMVACGLKKIDCKLFTIHCKSSRNTAVITDEKLIDRKFVKEKVTESIDKTALLEHLKAGKKVNGAKLGKTKEAIQIS